MKPVGAPRRRRLPCNDLFLIERAPVRLALSTLGCPELPLAHAADLAHREGYQGLELRSAPGTPVDTGSSSQQRAQWALDLQQTGVSALSVASYVKVCDAAVDDQTVIDAALGQARLAHDVGAPWLRVFAGGARGAPPDPAVDAMGGRRLAAIAEATAPLGVRLALETHDSHPTGRDVLRLIDAAEGAEVAVVWDVLHTWLGREDPEETAHLIGERTAYVQVKDVADRDDLAPLLLGEGTLPLQRCVDLVVQRDLTSWISWEYERAWHPQAPSLTQVGGHGARWLARAIDRAAQRG